MIPIAMIFPLTGDKAIRSNFVYARFPVFDAIITSFNNASMYSIFSVTVSIFACAIIRLLSSPSSIVSYNFL